jgi:hypothetical protein
MHSYCHLRGYSFLQCLINESIEKDTLKMCHNADIMYPNSAVTDGEYVHSTN